MQDAQNPAKLYYSISEVAELTGVKAHVLRYWESEFPTLRPRKSRSGSRTYRWHDVEEVLAIRDLLYKEGFRIDGARKLRRQAHKNRRDDDAAKVDAAPQLAIKFAQLDRPEQIARLKQELREILDLVRALGRPAARR